MFKSIRFKQLKERKYFDSTEKINEELKNLNQEIDELNARLKNSEKLEERVVIVDRMTEIVREGSDLVSLNHKVTKKKIKKETRILIKNTIKEIIKI